LILDTDWIAVKTDKNNNNNNTNNNTNNNQKKTGNSINWKADIDTGSRCKINVILV